MSQLHTLHNKLSLLARPNMSWGVNTDRLTLTITSSRAPGRPLLVYSFAPVSDDWQEKQAEVILGFSEMVETIAAVIEDTPRSQRTPIRLSGQIFNTGYMLNSHDLSNHFELSLEALEEDSQLW